MPRPKSYDRTEAIEKACRAFWEHGYQALGVRELEKLTGINQFAIRSEFGGKQGLFLETLKFYSDAAVKFELEPRKNGGLVEIQNFIRDLVKEGSAVSSPWGCLIVNTGIENARVGSDQIEKAIANYWKTLEKFFQQLLKNAGDREEIVSTINYKTVARGLVTAVMGIHARNRLAELHDGGRELADLVCSYLDSFKKP